MKKFLSFLLCFFITFNIFSYNGLLTGVEDIRIVKTKWFDIIYPDSAERGASLLYENADKIYEEVTGQYGLEPSYRVVVTITDQRDSYNAFSAPVPYNRIVLFHTSTSNLDDLSGSFEELFLSTFRHELTHTVTFNMKNGFWDGVTDIFGDTMVPGFLFISQGLAEGAAVTSESSDGINGRLNDEFTTHMPKQAKIEGCFPSYYDLLGANGTTTYPLCYYFHGAFHDYLQKKYGMEKYAQWWHRVINLNRPGESWCFKKTYGTSIRKEWKNFVDSYEVPEVIKNPVEDNVVYDFFETGKSSYSAMNKSGARFNELYKCDTGIYFSVDLLQDRYCKRIYFVPNENLFDEKIKPELVFTHQIAESYMPSKDGRFIVVSGANTACANMQSQIRIYDNNSKEFFNVENERLKNGSIVKSGSDYYLVAHKFKSPNNVLVIKKILFEDDKITGFEDIFEEEQPLNHIICSFTDLGNGTFAYIRKAYDDFIITVSDLKGNVIAEYFLPDGVKIRQISESDNGRNIYFSWVEKGSMPRLGKLDPKSGDFTFSKTDLSGGIFNPVVVNNNGKEKYIYIGTFFNENRILSFDSDSKILADTKIVNNGVKSGSRISKKEQTVFTDISSVSEHYNRMKNIHHGVIIPASLYSANMIGENYGSSSNSQFLPVGISYVTSNPWNGGNTFDDLLLLTAGWGPLTNSFGVEARLNLGTGTSALITSVDLKSEFDRNGWKQSGGEFKLTSGFNFGKTSTFIIQNNLQITGGRQNNLDKEFNLFNWDGSSIFELNAPVKNNVAFNISNITDFEYSNITARGPGKYEYGGVCFGANAGYVYDSVAGQGFVFNPKLAISLPKLIPVIQKRGFTYNLPLRIDFSLMPVISDYGLTNATFKNANSSLLDFDAEAVLFGIDVQKAIPYFDVFFLNEFYITAGYNSAIATYNGHRKASFQLPYMFEYFKNLGNGKSIYLDSVYMDVVLKLTPNIGILANSMAGLDLNFYGRACYSIHVLPGEKNGFNFSFGVRADF